MESATLRILGPEDAALYQALRLRALRESPEAFGSTHEEEVGLSLDIVASRLEHSIVPRGRVVVGAFVSGALVGVVGSLQNDKAKMRHKAVIWGMYVASDARGRGVGRLLIDRAIAETRTWKGVERVTLTVVERNEAARRLYRAAGFEVFGREPDALRQDGIRDTMEYMTLRLRATGNGS